MKYSFRARIILITVCVVLVLSGINYFVGRSLLRQELSDTFQSQMRVVGHNLALQLDRQLLSEASVEDVHGFEEVCLETVTLYPIIAHAMVVDPVGRILFHDDPLRQGRLLSEEAVLDAVGDVAEMHYVYRRQTGESIRVTLIPVFDVAGQHVATVLLESSERMIDQRLQRILMYFILSVIVELSLVVVLVLTVFSANVTRPIKQLSMAVEESADKSALELLRVNAAFQDEAEGLAHALDNFADRFQGVIDDLDERATVYRMDAERRAVQLEVVAEIVQAANRALDFEVLLTQIVDLLTKRFDLYYAGLFLLDEAGEWAELQAATGLVGQQRVQRDYRVHIGPGTTVGYVAEWGVARIASRSEVETLVLSNPDLPDVRSQMALPLRARAKIIGVLEINSTLSGAFDDEDDAEFQMLANQIALIISNTRLFLQVQAGSDVERRAYGVGYQVWKELLPAHSGLSYISDQQGISLAPAAWQTQMERAMSSGEIAVGGEEDSALAVPIKVRGYTIGVVDAQKATQTGAWSLEEQTLMQSLIEQLGTAIESARLYQDTQRRANRERAIAEVTGQVRASLELEDVLRAAAGEIRKAMGLERIVVRLAVPQTPQEKGEE